MRRWMKYALATLGTLTLAPALLLGTDWGSGQLAFADTGALTFDAELSASYPQADCPAGTPNSVECFTRTGSGTIRGLGQVIEAYPYFVENAPAGCSADQVRVLPTTIRLSIAGKGAIELRAGGSGCLTRVPPAPVRGEETFTITGGSGRYAGASGGGTITHESNGPPGWRGRDTWTGRLVVPGLDFDLAPPVVAGARNRLVRAVRGMKRIRVTYNVTAIDAVDGAVPANCRPRSGSRLSLGRNVVRCSATDSSANTKTASFTVVVKAKR
jgi:HYR domain